MQLLQPTEFDETQLKTKPNFKPTEDCQWNHLLKKSFKKMKREACRQRLLPHLLVVRKQDVSENFSKQSAVAVSRSFSRKPRSGKFDPRTLSRLCFRKSRLSEDELKTLCDARAEWDEFDRAYPLAEEFVRIIRGQSSMKLSLWVVRALDSRVKELKSFANGLQKDFLAVKEAAVSKWSNGRLKGKSTS